MFDPGANLGLVVILRALNLVDMGPLSHRSWKRFHLGTTLDQAKHGSVCPLLVVKQVPDKPYARVLVAVDLSPGSMPLIDFAGRFSTPTMLTLFHAIDTLDETELRSVDVSDEAIQANRFGSRLQARDRLAQIIGALDVNRHPLAFDVGHGDPAYTTALHLQATQGELVVVGKQRSSLLAQFFTGSVAQRLAKWADSDVLVVPLERLNAGMFAEVSH